MSSVGQRIGFVLGLEWDAPGGVQRVTRREAQVSARAGKRVHVLALASAGEAESERWESGLLVRRLSPSRVDEETTNFEHLSRRPRLEREVLGWCAQHGLDFVHLEHLSAFGLGLPSRLRARGVAFDWTLHDYHAWCPRGQMWPVEGDLCESINPPRCASCWGSTWPQLGTAQAAEREVHARQQLAAEALQAASAVYVPSRAASAVAQACGASAETLTLRANPTEAPIWRLPARPFDTAHVRIGVFGSVQPSKGVLELARWVAELGAPFELEVRGPVGDYHGDLRYADELRQLAQEEPRIELHGSYTPHALPLLFAGLDLLCVPSLWNEVFGLVAHEAHGAGVPVFVSDRGGLVQAPGYALPAGDEQAWKAALDRFARDGAWRAVLCGKDR